MKLKQAALSMCVVLGISGLAMAGDRTQSASLAQQRWTLKRDSVLDGTLLHPQRERVQLSIQTRSPNQKVLRGQFQDRLISTGKTEPSTFTGELVTKEKTMLMLRQQRTEGAKQFVAVHTGLAVSTNVYRGTWHDNAGGSGDFEFALEHAGLKGENIALHKHVTSNNNRSRRPARRLTDGHWATDAYPGAYAFDYTVDLTKSAQAGRQIWTEGYDIHAVAIYWGHYGRHFPGSTGRGSYKADYVKSYQLEYMDQNEKWHTLHKHQGRPTDEKAGNVQVTKFPANSTFSDGEVMTVLDGLEIQNAVAIRIRAKGGHWIGLYELEIYGEPTRTTSLPVQSAQLPNNKLAKATTLAVVGTVIHVKDRSKDGRMGQLVKIEINGILKGAHAGETLTLSTANAPDGRRFSLKESGVFLLHLSSGRFHLVDPKNGFASFGQPKTSEPVAQKDIFETEKKLRQWMKVNLRNNTVHGSLEYIRNITQFKVHISHEIENLKWGKNSAIDFNASCPGDKVLQVIGAQWTSRVIEEYKANEQAFQGRITHRYEKDRIVFFLDRG